MEPPLGVFGNCVGASGLLWQLNHAGEDGATAGAVNPYWWKYDALYSFQNKWWFNKG